MRSTPGEQARLSKEIERAESESARIAKKLGNPNFVEKAPAEVVEKERVRRAELEAVLKTLTEQRQSLNNL